jgi:hypothetical protein
MRPNIKGIDIIDAISHKQLHYYYTLFIDIVYNIGTILCTDDESMALTLKAKGVFTKRALVTSQAN